MIVRGVELTGLLTMRYAHGCAWLNDLEWLSAPAPHGFMVPKSTFDAAELSPAAMKRLKSVPRVIQLEHEGWSTNRAIGIYFTQQDSLLEHVSDVYRKSLPLGKDAAARAARLAIDPGLASRDPAGPQAPTFSSSGSTVLYFIGSGNLGLIREGTAKEPTPRETAAWLLSRAQGHYEELGRMLELDAPVFALTTAGTTAFYIGGDATRAFAEWDRLRAARSSEERREIGRGLKLLPPNLAAEFESAQPHNAARP